MMANNAQQDVQTIRLPLVGSENPGTYFGSDAGYWPDQSFVNCFPLVGKNPVQDDSGDVRIVSRANFNYPEETITNLNTILGAGYLNAVPKAVLGMKGVGNNTIILVAYTTITGANYELRVVDYRPGTGPTGATLVLTVNLTSYGLSDFNCDVHLTQISHSTYQGFAVSFHPEAYASSTTANSDVYYSWITNPASAATWTWSGGAGGGAIAAAGFPTNTPAKGIVGPVQQLNNVHYIMTVDGFIYGSYPSTTSPFNPDITTWNTSGNTASYQNPDGGAGLIRYKHHLLAFGQNSCEFFNDEGIAQPSLPIRRTQQAFLKVGLLNAKSICIVNDDLYWLGISGDTGQLGLYRLSGYTAELISSVKINNKLNDRAAYSGMLTVMSMHGSTHLLTHVLSRPMLAWGGTDVDERPENNYLTGQLVYCIDSKVWWTLAFDHQYKDGSYRTPQIYVAQASTGYAPYQYVWVTLGNSINSYNYSLHCCSLFSYYTMGDYYCYDQFRRDNTNTPILKESWTIPIQWTTNSFDFGTNNRKLLRRARLIMRIPNTDTSEASSDAVIPILNNYGQNLTLSVYKDRKADEFNNNATATMTYEIALETLIDNPSMNMNNLGHCRKVKFACCTNTYQKLEFLALDVTMTMAEH